jgi:hypothetical protein|tara:strand:+ start:728 stop:907 length:180 start_codon:yes stop_codon:yes gene_type:complete
MTKDGITHPGPNIIAEDLAQAEAAAESNNLTLLGEFKEIFIENDLMSYLDEKISNKILH